MKFQKIKKPVNQFLDLASKPKLKEKWRSYGWKSLILIFLYYLVRDTLLYVVIPVLFIV